MLKVPRAFLKINAFQISVGLYGRIVHKLHDPFRATYPHRRGSSTLKKGSCGALRPKALSKMLKAPKVFLKISDYHILEVITLTYILLK